MRRSADPAHCLTPPRGHFLSLRRMSSCVESLASCCDGFVGEVDADSAGW
ncbi:hypothetical protein ACFPRL_24015 [Pseudoclavibacter helvolus]